MRAVPLLLLLIGSSLPAFAESGLILPYPPHFGHVPAATYDAKGQRVGSANLVVEELESGVVRIYSQSGLENGASTIARADLVPVEPRESLRLVRQESRSFDPSGAPLGVLSVNHGSGTASCRSPGGDITEFELPRSDRIANVPMNLLFQPLVWGEQDSIDFQVFMCSGGPRVVDFRAYVATNGNASGGPVEVRYEPELGMFSAIARAFVPQLSFWFQPEAPHAWVGHRMPLYSKGPEVLVVRDGVALRHLTVEH